MSDGPQLLVVSDEQKASIDQYNNGIAHFRATQPVDAKQTMWIAVRKLILGRKL